MVSVELRKWTIKDDDLKEVAGLTKLFGLDLRETAVTAAGLEHLKGSFKVLHLPPSAQTNTGVKRYLDLVKPKPTMLSLVGWKVDGGVVKELAGQKQLRKLVLAGIPVTDEDA